MTIEQPQPQQQQPSQTQTLQIKITLLRRFIEKREYDSNFDNLLYEMTANIDKLPKNIQYQLLLDLQTVDPSQLNKQQIQQIIKYIYQYSQQPKREKYQINSQLINLTFKSQGDKKEINQIFQKSDGIQQDSIKTLEQKLTLLATIINYSIYSYYIYITIVILNIVTSQHEWFNNDNIESIQQKFTQFIDQNNIQIEEITKMKPGQAQKYLHNLYILVKQKYTSNLVKANYLNVILNREYKNIQIAIQTLIDLQSYKDASLLLKSIYKCIFVLYHTTDWLQIQQIFLVVFDLLLRSIQSIKQEYLQKMLSIFCKCNQGLTTLTESDLQPIFTDINQLFQIQDLDTDQFTKAQVLCVEFLCNLLYVNNIIVLQRCVDLYQITQRLQVIYQNSQPREQEKIMIFIDQLLDQQGQQQLQQYLVDKLEDVYKIFENGQQYCNS